MSPNDRQRLVLASQSPRRRELLRSAGFEFDVILPDPSAEPDGDMPEPGEPISAYVRRLAEQKALSVSKSLSDPAIVIGCDTVADVAGQLLGKPRDIEDAARMLKLLSGRKHSVWSGLCLVDSQSGQIATDTAESVLEMSPLSPRQLDEYLTSGAWQGKSGAFGYQDGHPWLKILSGTSDNVVGLPIDLLRSMLRDFAT